MALALNSGVSGSSGQIDLERKTIAFVADDDTAAALRAGLTVLGEALDVRRGTVRHAIRFFRTLEPVNAAIIDIAELAEPRVELEELARVCPPDVRVFLIGDNTDIGFYRLLVHDLGAADYVPKPLTRDTVQRLLLPRLSGTEVDIPDSRGGNVIAVCGARGGVGATTIAVNAALQLVGVTQAQTVLLDLNLQTGTSAMMLAARPGPGLRIALEEPERTDSLFLERAAIKIDPRLRLVAAEEALDPSPTITPEGVDQVLELLRQKFNFVFVDLPVPVPPPLKRVLNLARQVVVVLGPDLPSLRDAKAIRHMVTISTGSDRVMTVLNRADMRGGLDKELIQKGLGQPPDLIIPDLGPRMMEAVNLGVPALQRVPTLRRHLMPLVREIAGVRTAPNRSFVSRIFKR
jgi:pilus assembly protein CpaE